MANYTTQLNNLKNAQRKAAVADLQNTRNTALSNLQAEQQQNKANYAVQRNTANAQNRLSARNFQEYLANTGRANSGLGAQASMQSANNLNTSMNNIYGAENAALADIARRRTDAQNAYSSGLASANATIEANYIQNLLKQQQQDWENKMALKQFNESVRQFNKNYDLQKKSFSSGSGGGRTYSGSRGYRSSGSGINLSGGNVQDTNREAVANVTNAITNAAKLTNNAINKIGSQNAATQKAAKVGQRYVKQVKDKKGNVVSQLWMKTKDGKDYRVA